MTWIWLYAKFCLSIRRLKVFLTINSAFFSAAKLLGVQVFVKGSNTSVKSRNMAKKSSFVEDNFSLVKRVDKNLHTTLHYVWAMMWCKTFKCCYFTDTTLLIGVSWTPTTEKENYLELLSVQALWTSSVRHLNFLAPEQCH